MNVIFSSLSQQSKVLTNKSNNNSNVLFKGNIENNTEDIPMENTASISNSVRVHPMYLLNFQLLNDGYTLEEIKSSRIYDATGFLNKRKKTMADAFAMNRAYSSLKQKLNTPDVQKSIADRSALFDDLTQFLIKKGKADVTSNKKDYLKEMILEILHRVDKNNEPLLQELLNDDEFDNNFISNALMKLNDTYDAKYGLCVLEMAQEFGYDKSFSFPLAVMISEAKPNNLDMIEKMIQEQDFFVDNEDFTCNRLINLLRNAGSGLSAAYVENDEITLREVEELLEDYDD